jgi:hypothetical protein
MAEPSHDYHRGEMDIHEQQATFHGFNLMTKWGSLIIAVGTLFFTLWFCTGAGFIGAAISAFVVAVIGVLVLRDKKSAAH